LEWICTSFLQSLPELFYHSSWRTASSYFRDVEGRNLFLILVSKTDQSGSIVFKSGEYAGQGRCWSSPSCPSNHDWTVQAVWIGTLSSWKTASLFGNNVWIMGCTLLLNLSMYSLGVIRPWRVIMDQQNIAAQIITEPLPCFTAGTRHSGL
jgi:hypothetical protein